MNNLKYLFLILSVSFIYCKGQPTEQKTTMPEIESGVVDVETFESLVNSDYLLIDIRTPEEFSEGFISKAQNINFYNDDFESQLLKLNKADPVLIYCKSGGRSGKTYSMLKANGFSKVYDLKGGFTAWREANKPVLK